MEAEVEEEKLNREETKEHQKWKYPWKSTIQEVLPRYMLKPQTATQYPKPYPGRKLKKEPEGKLPIMNPEEEDQIDQFGFVEQYKNSPHYKLLISHFVNGGLMHPIWLGDYPPIFNYAEDEYPPPHYIDSHNDGTFLNGFYTMEEGGEPEEVSQGELLQYYGRGLNVNGDIIEVEDLDELETEEEDQLEEDEPDLEGTGMTLEEWEEDRRQTRDFVNDLQALFSNYS
jgi:hypothetical protein